MQTLTLIIVTYKHRQLVDDLLRSIDIYNDLDERLKVIIVDNSPDEEIADLIEQNTYITSIRYIKNINNGYGKANNIGAKQAESDYLLFLNPDTRLVEPIFKQALKVFEDYDMFGVQLINTNNSKNFSFRYNIPYTLASAINNRLIKLTNKFNAKKHYILGADIFIKTDVFFRIGGFDENIFMYNEEFDLSRRLLNEGYSIGYVSGIRLIHLEGSGEYEKIDITSRKRFLCSFKYVCHKYGLNYETQLKKQRRFVVLRLFISKLMLRNVDSLNELKKMYDWELNK